MKCTVKQITWEFTDPAPVLDGAKEFGVGLTLLIAVALFAAWWSGRTPPPPALATA